MRLKPVTAIIVLLLAASLSVTGCTINYAPSSQASSTPTPTTSPATEPFTELYLLGPEGEPRDYPTNLTVNQMANVIVGVVNHEGDSHNYKLVVTLANSTIYTTYFGLSNNQTWQRSISFTPTNRGLGQKIEFDLYKPGTQNVFRSAYLYINVT